MAKREQWLAAHRVVPAVADEPSFAVLGNPVASRVVFAGRGVFETSGQRHRKTAAGFNIARQNVGERTTELLTREPHVQDSLNLMQPGHGHR